MISNSAVFALVACAAGIIRRPLRKAALMMPLRVRPGSTPTDETVGEPPSQRLTNAEDQKGKGRGDAALRIVMCRTLTR